MLAVCDVWLDKRPCLTVSSIFWSDLIVRQCVQVKARSLREVSGYLRFSFKLTHGEDNYCYAADDADVYIILTVLPPDLHEALARQHNYSPAWLKDYMERVTVFTKEDMQMSGILPREHEVGLSCILCTLCSCLM